MNRYVVFYAVNWPDALLDRNGAEHWPLNYDFVGVFQADSLDGLWDLLNRDDRPNAQMSRSMCVGDTAVVAEADSASGEACGQMWIVRKIGWEELHPASDRPIPRVIGVNWPDPLLHVTGVVEERDNRGGLPIPCRQ
jgi:hypothetical protein